MTSKTCPTRPQSSSFCCGNASSVAAQRAELGILTAVLLLSGAAVQAGPPAYLVTDVPAPEGSFSYNPTAINDAGHIVGWAQFSQSPGLRAWRWSPEDGLVVLPQPPGATGYRAMDINDAGVIAGDGGSDGGIAWRFENDRYTILGTLPGLPISNAEGINNANEIAGTAKDFSVLTPNRAYIHRDADGMINITPGFGARGTGINSAGQVCGYSQSNSAFRWTEENGVQFLPAPDGLPFTFAFAINDLGQIVGEAKSLNGNIARAFIFTEGVGTQTLPHLAGQLNQALGVNNHSQVVGYSDPPGSLLGWMWSAQTGLLILNDLIDPDENLNIIRALDINDAGQIVAKGTDTAVGGQRLVVLTPISDAVPGDLNGDGVVDVFDLLILLSAWGECPNPANCPADFNGDGVVDVFDLLMLLSNWG